MGEDRAPLFADMKGGEEEEDRLSSLPDSLMIEIISRLPDTEEAVRTGILSKQWKHLWTQVPNLFFHHLKGNENKDSQSLIDFFSYLEKTITQSSHLNLAKFQLITNYDDKFKYHVNNSICHAINYNVQQFRACIRMWRMTNGVLYMRNSETFFNNSCFTHLYVYHCMFNPSGTIRWKNLRSLRIDWGKLDEGLIQNILSGSPLSGSPLFKIDSKSFFINSCLTHLNVQHCMFNPSGTISWKNLRSLCIRWGKLDEGLIQNILSGSPLLETIFIQYCRGLRRIYITWKSVKTLVFSGPSFDVDFKNSGIEINAPHILTLYIIERLTVDKLKLLNVSSLVKAELDYKISWSSKEEEEDMLATFTQSLRHVKELKIGQDCLETLSRLEAKGFTVPSNIVKHPDPDPCDWFCKSLRLMGL